MAALALTFFGWRSVWRSGADLAQARFLAQAETLKNRIEERMQDSERVLLGCAGLFDASTEVERAEWRAYVEALQVQKTEPGVQGFGFAKAIPAAALAEHTRKIRAEGFPDYTVRPDSARSEYTSIIYLEPFRDRNLRAFGFDMFTEPVRRTAMRRARDNAETALSGKVTLVQEVPGQAEQAGFLLYVPVYTNGRPPKRPADRQAALLGWAYCPFRAEDFIDEILFRNRLDLSLVAYDGTEVKPGALLYNSATRPQAERTEPGYQPLFARTSKIHIYGQTWTLVVHSTPSLESHLESLRPTMTLAGGLALSFLLFGLVWGQASRSRALALAQRMTTAWEESEESNHLLIQNLHSGVVAYAPDGRILLCNPQAVRMLDLPSDATQGASAEYATRQFFNADGAALPAVEQPFQRVLATGQPVRGLVVGLERPTAGDRQWLLANAFAELGPDQKLRRIVATFADITERKRAEEALARANAELEHRVQERTAELGQSQAFLESIIEHSPNSLWISDASGTLLKMNQACRDQLHLRDAEVVGKYNLLQDNLVEAQGFMPQVQAVFAKGVPTRFVISYDTAAVTGLEVEHKTKAILDVHISPILDAQGKVTNAVVQHVDITEHRRAEEQIIRLATELRVILGTLSSGVSFLKDRKVKSANAAHDQMFGYAPGATVGLETVTFYAHAEDHARIGREGYEVLTKGGVFRTEAEMRRKDGSVFPCSLTGRAIDPQNLDAGSIWQCEDITERRRAEAELRASEERYRLLVNTSPDTILLHREGRIVFANQAALRFFGATRPEDLVGTPLLDLVHPLYRQIVLDRVRESLTSGGFLPPLEEKLLRLDGTSVDAEVTGGSLVLDGLPTMQVVARDITGRKRQAEVLAARSRLLAFAQTHSLEELLRATLDEVEALTGSCIGFYHFLQADQKTLSLQVWSTNTGQKMCQAEGAGRHYPVDQAGVWVDCIRERRAVIHNDYPSLPNKRGLPAGHAPLLRQLVAPVLRGGQIVAILGVGNKPALYTTEDVQSVESLADLGWDIAERMRAEAALRESEAHYRSLLNMMNGFSYCRIVYVDGRPADFTYLEVNRAFETLTGLKDVVGKNVSEVIPGIHETNPELFEIYGRVALTGVPESFETNIKPLDMWFSASVYSPQKDHFVVVFDITTARKKAEAALQQSEANLRAFFDTINDFAWVLDPQGNILHVNATVTARLGYPEAELVGQSVLAVHPEARRAEAGRIVGEMLAGQCEFCPVPLLTRDGRQIPVETRVMPGRWSGQDALFGISKDISELHASEEKFSKAFLHNPALMAVSELSDGRYIEVNDSFLHTLGFNRDEVLGRTSMELGVLTATSEREAWVEELKRSGSIHNKEMTVRTKDGHQRTGLFSGDVVELQGRPVLLTVLSDITERKQVEAELAAERWRLNHLFEHAPVAIWLEDFTALDQWMAQLRRSGVTDLADYLRGRPEELRHALSLIRLLDMNPAAVTQNAASSKQHLLQSLPQLFDERTYTDFTAELLALWNGRLCFEYESHSRRLDGRPLVGIVRLDIPVRDGQPDFSHVVISGTDITERKQAEAEREEALSRLQKISSQVPGVVYQYRLRPDGTSCFPYASDGIHEIYRVSPEDVREDASAVFAILHPDDRDEIVATVLQSARDLTPWFHEYRVKFTDGTVCWLSGNALPQREADGGTLWHGFITGITLRKQLESAREEALGRLQKIASRVPGVVYQYRRRPDGTSCFPYVSDGLREIYGINPEEVRDDATKVLESHHPEDRARLLDSIQKSAQDLTPWSQEFRLQLPDGTVRWLASSSMPQREADGATLWHGFTRDITERKQAEAKLQELLAQTQRDAHTKAELLKEVNHRVKNNLLAIVGLATTEHRHLSVEEKPLVRDFIGNLRRRIGGLLEVHQMLSAAQWAPLMVNQLARKIIQSALAAAPSSCSVKVNLQPSDVRVSPRQASNLGLVFNELATNTVKYALGNRSAATITFAASATESLIRLEYRDDGPGYPPEVLRQEKLNVGMILLRDLTTQTLRGQLTIANDDGAVTVLEIKTEEVDRT